MVWEQLREDLIFPRLEVEDSSDVMKKMGKAFIDKEICKETYIDALIKREVEFPTGIDVDGFGIAIPHTDVSHVNQASIGIAILEEPVKFIQMGTDDEEVETKIVVMLAVDDPQKHLALLQNILEILQDKNVLNELSNSKEVNDIIKIIKNKESK